MKTIQVQKSFKVYTDIEIRYHELIKLANKGLLGEIEHSSADSKHRNFNSKNCNRAYIVLFSQKCLGVDLSDEQILKLFNGDKSIKEDLLRQAIRIKEKGIPKFVELLNEVNCETN